MYMSDITHLPQLLIKLVFILTLSLCLLCLDNRVQRLTDGKQKRQYKKIKGSIQKFQYLTNGSPRKQENKENEREKIIKQVKAYFLEQKIMCLWIYRAKEFLDFTQSWKQFMLPSSKVERPYDIQIWVRVFSSSEQKLALDQKAALDLL